MTAQEDTAPEQPVVEPAVPAEVGAGDEPEWDAAEWHGKMLVDIDGKNIGKLQDVYVDAQSDTPQFGTVKEGLLDRHLTFVPLVGVHVGPGYLQVEATEAQVKSAPELKMHGEELTQDAEADLYHHFGLNYTAPDTVSGRRLARR